MTLMFSVTLGIFERCFIFLIFNFHLFFLIFKFNNELYYREQ